MKPIEKNLPPKLAPHRRASKPSSMDVSGQKIGTAKLPKKLVDSVLKSHFERRRILSIPPEIKAAHPDKHFVFVNLNKLQKNGFWHPEGYRLFKTEVDLENQNSQKFNYSSDGLLHRNEMVAAWIPKEEYEQRQLEKAIVRGDRDLSEIIAKNPNLAGFNPHASETREANLRNEEA